MARSNFYKLFPVPQFLKMSPAGIDVSDHMVRFAELSETKEGFVLRNYGERALPEGAVVAGEIKQEDSFKQVMRELRKEVTTEFVAVGLPEEQAYTFDLTLATSKKQELHSMLELELEEHVPIAVAETLFDYEETGSALAEKTDVAVSAVHERVVAMYMRSFSDTGFTPTVFEVEPNAIARAVIPAGDKGTYMIMDFGTTRTGICIVSEGSVLFASTVPVGGASLTNTISKELGVSHEDAEKIKREQGFARTQENEQLFNALMATVSVLRDELIRHFNYWHEHADAHARRRPHIQKVILCGGDSNLVGFTEFLSMGLHAPVELAQVIKNVNLLNQDLPSLSFSDSLRYSTAIGLAIRYPR
ncbi:MAG: type IV pilus assembly protein PilM [Minisyncoccota bacterium]